jgi:hypothetical protein
MPYSVALLTYISSMASEFHLTADDARRVEETVRRIPLPSYVGGFNVEFAETWDGDPGVWISFELLDDSVPSDKETLDGRLSEMNALVRRTQEDLFKILPDRWPYVRFTLASDTKSRLQQA